LLIPLLLLYILLNCLDYWLTQSSIKIGAKEINPIIKFIGLIPSKIVGTIILTTAYVITLDIKIWYAIDFILLGICIWNFIVYSRLNKCQ